MGTSEIHRLPGLEYIHTHTHIYTLLGPHAVLGSEKVSHSATNSLAAECLSHISLLLWKTREGREPPRHIRQLIGYSIGYLKQWEPYFPVTALLDLIWIALQLRGVS